MTPKNNNFVWLDDDTIERLSTIAQTTRLRRHVVIRAIVRYAYSETLKLPFDSPDPRVRFLALFPDASKPFS